MPEFNPACPIERLFLSHDFHATVDVLRLDGLHPVISGNKWFKLKEYLAEAKRGGKIILTYGGAFSNHIVATAAAAKQEGLRSIGIIRGEQSATPSPALLQAKAFGMDLYFISRAAYKLKSIPECVFQKYPPETLYFIPEGGYGTKGMEGTKDILLKNNTADYTHILSAVGTGTTVAGLTAAAQENQQVIGISVFKNNFSLQDEIKRLLHPNRQEHFLLQHDYHFGGYAKHTKDLFDFMNAFYLQSGIPTDFIYTAKSVYAAVDLVKKGFFMPGDKILLVHTGGLQGNLSLPKGTLMFG